MTVFLDSSALLCVAIEGRGRQVVIDALENDTNFIYNFGEKETLKRGEFEVLSRKSTAKISLFDMTEEG